MIKRISFLIFSLFCNGCLWAGMPLRTDQYKEFIGIRLEVLLFPAVINKNPLKFGEIPTITVPIKNNQYGHVVTDIPQGTIVTIHHINKKYNNYGEVFYEIFGFIDIVKYKGYVYLGECSSKKVSALGECIDLRKFRIIKSADHNTITH